MTGGQMGSSKQATRRGAGRQMAWGDLGADQVGAALAWRWPWDPDGATVAGSLLEPGYPLPTTVETSPQQVERRQVQEAITDEDGTELAPAIWEDVITQPAISETRQRWVHRVHVDDWDADTSLEMDADAQVTLA